MPEVPIDAPIQLENMSDEQIKQSLMRTLRRPILRSNLHPFDRPSIQF
jgi:hypothetical protein